VKVDPASPVILAAAHSRGEPMICALTVRTLKPGTFEQFREAFMQNEDPDNPPPGLVRFDMIRNIENPDEVISFGFFDGTAEELRRVAAEMDYAGQLEAIAPFVESVGANGLYEVVEEYAAD
jgi:quinol monooxygenase YgiN